MNKLLIVDDEERIRQVVVEYAKAFGYSCVEASDGQEALELALNQEFDCIILDLMLPKLDGFTVLKRIKEQKNTPILVLSARFEEEDKLYILSNGGEDYVVKPFSPKELMARIKLIVDRYAKAQYLHFEDLIVDIQGRVVKIKEQKINLTPKEIDLLFYLIQHKNTAISRDTLLLRIWGDSYYGDERTVDTHIKMLRKNLLMYKKFIVTVRGMGYKFEV